MKAEDLTRFTRWLIPGWTFFLTVAIFITIDLSFQYPGWEQFEKQIRQFLNQFGPLLTSIVVALAGIPLGFLIYQLYFFIRWNSPFRGYAASLRGEKMFNYPQWEIDESDFILEEHWRSSVLASYTGDARSLHRYKETFFLQACQYIDNRTQGPGFYERHRYLYEVIHTLGASIAAIVLAFFVYTIVRVYYEHTLPPFIYVFFSLILTIAFLYLLYHEYPQKGSPQTEPIQCNLCVSNGLVCFAHIPLQIVFTLWTLNIFLNPAFSTYTTAIFGVEINLGLILKIVFIGIIIITWNSSLISLTASSPRKKACRLGNWIVHAFVILLSAFFFQAIHNGLHESAVMHIQKHIIDWPFFTTFSTFLLLLLVLFVNRRNAIDDMINIELYVVKLFSQQTKSLHVSSPNTTRSIWKFLKSLF